MTGPSTLTAAQLVAWFKAPTTYVSGGKLIGFETPRTGVAAPTAGTYDRHLYMDNAGHIVFGVYNNNTYTITSPKTYTVTAENLSTKTYTVTVTVTGPDGRALALAQWRSRR